MLGARWMHRLFWTCLCVYWATAHAAIRSPDAEVLFEACDALKTRGSFAVEPVSAWEGFGVAAGRDGRTYSIFGPLGSIACVPLLAVVDALEPAALFDRWGIAPPPSHYVEGGLFAALDRAAPTEIEPHARRALVAWVFNAVVSALGVVLFFRIARRFASDDRAALVVAGVYALATPAWPYAGTFFSEPLATLLLLAAVDRLALPEGRDEPWHLVVGGLLAGLAAWAHVTAVLFAPFLLALAAWRRGAFAPAAALAFGAGLGIALGGLAAYHFALWGDPFETGRGADYGRFVAPWRGLYGLLLSPGKGLFVHVPIAVLAVWAFPAFVRRHRTLGAILVAALLFRLVFVAARSDWHGGFSPGPRLLVQAIPFLLLPLVPWLESRLDGRSPARIAFALLAIASFAIQWLFVAGEPFGVLHALRLEAMAAGQNVFEADRLYLDLHLAPLVHLPRGAVGPLLFRDVGAPLPLWALGLCSVLALAGGIVASAATKAEWLRARRAWWAPLALGAAVVALYAPSLGNGFTNWDDPQYVENNPFAARGWLGIPLAFLGVHEDAYYPVTHAIYAVIQALFGPSALAHHAVQVGLFAAGVSLLPWALAAFGIPASVGFWIALLWAAHPMRAESVSWAANLKDPAAFLGLVVAFGAYHRGRRKLSIAAFAAALLAKSMFFPLAGLFVLLDARTAGWKGALRRSAPYLGIALAVAFLGAYLHVLPSEARARTRPGGSLLGAVPSILYLPWWYLWRTLSLRHPQSVYTFEPVGWFDSRFALALVGWALLLLLLWRIPAKWRGPWRLGVAAWALPFLPVTGLSPLVHHVADRYAFLPSLAVVAGLVLGVRQLAPRLPRPVPALLAAAAILGQAAGSVARQADYRDAITLWEADLARAPENWTVRYNLAGAYGGVGRWDDALAQLEAALAIRPSEATEQWLAFARLARAGLPSERVPALAAALAAAEDPTPIWLEATRELVQRGNLEGARAILAELPRDRADVSFFVGMVDAAEGKTEDALARIGEAIARDPDLEQAHLFRASLLASLGRDEDLARLAAVHLPTSRARAELAKARAMALLRLRRPEEALAATEVEIEPAHRPIVSGARAAALLLLGRTEEARREAETGDGPGADRLLLRAILDQTEE